MSGRKERREPEGGERKGKYNGRRKEERIVDQKIRKQGWTRKYE